MHSGKMLIVALLLLVPGAAQAQFTLPPQAPPQTPGSIRVGVSFGGPIAIQNGISSEELKKVTESARVQVYENARNECATLSKAFDAECKLVTVFVNVNNQFGNIPTLNTSGSALYELMPRDQH